MRKLLIFTSRRLESSEFDKYWDTPKSDIVFDGRLYFKAGDWDFDKIDNLITSKNFLVFLHQGTEGKTGDRDTHDKRFSYKVFYYSTLDPKLRKDDLWSWGNDLSEKFECDKPVLPFDLLCCALHENDPRKIEEAKTRIFEWYKKKEKKELDFNLYFKILKLCLTPKGAAQALPLYQKEDEIKSIINELSNVKQKYFLDDDHYVLKLEVLRKKMLDARIS